MNFIKEDWFKIIIAIVIILIGFSFFYYYVIFIPQREQDRIEQVKQEQLTKEIKEQEAKAETERQARLNKILLDACLSDAQTSYVNFWDSECEGLGREKDCKLPMYLVDRLDESLEKDKNECFKKYPQR